ncbi:hypothetical protein Mapa_004466 [Marchantia paleacea]|nr:hypothetical protein Mapa_004466 [Marchantia paleacea]
MAMVGTRIAVARTVSSIVAPLWGALPCSASCPTSFTCRSSSFSRFAASPSRSLHSLHSSVTLCTSSPAAASTSVQTSESTSPPPAAPAVTQAELDALDIRVGKVIKAWKHPEADSLYVEEVDLAEVEGPRTICSGLVKYLSLEELEGRDVVVLANLKPRNMRGVKSNGMLLAASNAEHTTVQLLFPPDGAAPGERVWFGAEADQCEQAAAATPNQIAKKKIWESVQPLLRTTEECVAVCQSKPMRTSAGVVKCQSLQGANIA